MRFLTIAASTLLLTQFGAFTVLAQDEPARVAQRHFDALAAGQWDSAAAVMDSAYVERFRRLALGTFVSLARQHDVIKQLHDHPMHGGGALHPFAIDTAPADTALARFALWRVPLLGANATIGALATMPARELLTRSYATAGLLCDDGRCLERNPWSHTAVLGTVFENDSTASVQVRQSSSSGGSQAAGASPVQEVRLVRRKGGPWLISDAPAMPPLPLSALFDERVGILPPPMPSATSSKPNE